MISLADMLSLLLGYTVSLSAYFLPSLLLSRLRRTTTITTPQGKQNSRTVATEPSGWMILLSLLFAAVAFATDFGTPISVFPAVLNATSSSSNTPTTEAKPYATFQDFYTRYEAEHQVPLDRTLHVALFTLATAFMM